MDSAASLTQRLRKAERRGHWRAYALIAPLFIFVALSFLLPLGTVLLNSVYDPLVPDGLPRTVRALAAWNGPRDQVPPEPVYAALAQDLKEAVAAEKQGAIANRLNIEESGLRTTFMRAARRVNTQEEGPWAPFFEEADPAWAQPGIWGTIRNLQSPSHTLYFLSALDAKRNQDGSVSAQSEDQRIHITIYLRTLGVAFTVTFMCVLLGFPLSYLLAHLRDKTANLLLILVLLPFWTSLLVRTTAWMVVLQKEGVLNSLLQALHARLGAKAKIEIDHTFASNHIARSGARVDVADLPTRGLEELIALVPFDGHQFGQGRSDQVNGVFGQMRIGNVPLQAFDHQFAAQGATTPVFDHVATDVDRCGLSHNAPIQPLLLGGEPITHGHCAMGCGTFFVTGQ